MIPTGVALFVASGVLATWSIVMLNRANPDTRVPWMFGSPPRVPWPAIGLRALGAGAGVLGAILLRALLGYWGPVLVVGVWIPAFVVQLAHNRSVLGPTPSDARSR